MGEESLPDEGTAEGREKQSGGFDLTEKKTRYINAELDLNKRRIPIRDLRRSVG